MKLSIKAHRWINVNGDRSAAHCFPYVDGVPCHEIASCNYCKAYREDAEICKAWENEDPPLFCGPICSRLNLTDEGVEVAERFLESNTTVVSAGIKNV